MNFVNKKLHARKLVLMLFDLLCLLVVSVGYFLINYWLTYRFSDEPMRYFYASGRYWMDVLFLIIGIHLVRIVFRIYSNVYRYADIAVYLKIVIADALGGILAMLASGLVFLLVMIGIEHSKLQYAGGILLQPVQTLVATLICSHREQMQTIPLILCYS